MHEQYLADPTSVSESWQDFFADYRRDAAPAGRGRHAAGPLRAAGPPQRRPGAARPRRPATHASRAPAAEPSGEPIRGAAARIVANMEASLEVPTATSFRSVPAKLLEVNRRVINGYLGRTRGGKVSFTHLIGFAVVRAIHETVPVMNSSLRRGRRRQAPRRPPRARQPRHRRRRREERRQPHAARPGRARRRHARLPWFWGAYEELIRKVRSNKLSPDDFAGTTVSLTNPGTIGTQQSVPRLMPGQGVIVGVGSLDYPTEWKAADPVTLAELGVSKVITISSTYDHRIIQGAESGLFLKRVEELLLGVDGFYDEVFRALGVPYEAVQWRRDVNPIDREQAMLEKQMAVANLIRVHRVRGHLIADLDPLRWKEPQMPVELDPATYGLTIWDLDREFLTGGLGGRERMALGDILHVLRDAYCRTIGIEYMHIQDQEEQRWIQDQVEGVSPELALDDQRYILERLNAAEAFEKFLATKYVGQKRFGLEGAESAIPILDAILEARRRRRPRRHRHRHAPPRAAQRAHQHRRQELRPALQGVRGPGRPRLDAGLRRREVPPRPDRASSSPAPARTSPSSWPPTPATSRPSTRWSWAWRAPSRTPSTTPRRSRSCRSSCTATRPSPARAWWPRRST